MERRTSRVLRPAYDDALDPAQAADFVHCDETSWRRVALVRGDADAQGLPDRQEAQPRGFPQAALRLRGHPRLGPLLGLRAHDTEKRQLCWAHVLRNFRGLEEAGGKARSLGRAGQKIVKAVFKEWYHVRDGNLTRRGLRRRLAPLRLRSRLPVLAS
jgi:transposase